MTQVREDQVLGGIKVLEISDLSNRKVESDPYQIEYRDLIRPNEYWCSSCKAHGTSG